MTVTLSPLAVQQYFDANSVELVGGKIFAYLAGTTTKTPTYVDSGGITPNTNPIVLSARGEANIWLVNNIAYKFVLAPPTDSDPPSNPIWTVDNILSGGVSSFSAGTTGLTPSSPTSGAVVLAGTLVVANGGTNATSPGITAFNNITGYTAAGATGTTSTNLVFSTNPTILTATLTTPTLTGATMDAASTVSDSGTIATNSVGFRGIPQNAQTGAYVLALTDDGKHISITTGGITIPANASIAFPIGSTIVIFNNSSSNQTIAITTDTLKQAGTSNTGSRVLAQNGLATIVKVASTTWAISGAGLT